ncbi:MBL fold metallo-hydrolase [Clostridia bacterium]|nr:MBL fold metallo-hydrolase [Clostridia bacterium]
MRATDHIYVLSGGCYGAVGDRSVLGEVYGIRTEAGMILIDCGIPGAGPAMIRETLDYYGIKDKITHVVVTHAHYDHAGGAKELQAGGAKIIVGAPDERLCLNGGPSALASPFNGEHLYPAFTPDILIDRDQTLELNGLELELISIPGHTPGSMAVRANIDRRTVMFTGDALQPDGQQLEVVSLGWRGDVNFSGAAVVSSMMKLMELETDIILPGHGKICLRNGTSVLRLAAQTAFMTLR